MNKTGQGLLLIGLFGIWTALAAHGEVSTKEGPVTMAAEKLRLSMFADNPSKTACRILSRGLTSSLPEYSGSLQGVVDKTIGLVNKRNDKELRQLFHPRLKISRSQIAKLYDDLIGFYGASDLTISPYRVYAFNTVDGTPNDIICEEDQVVFSAHYGYGLQLALWLQVRGKEELGRLFLTIVPDPDGWYLASWHQQQWTHLGSDYERWIERALTESAEQRKLGAYVMYDVAAKLLDGGKHLRINVRDQVVNARDAMLPVDQNWLGVIKGLLPKDDVGYAGTGLMKDGAGIFLRLQVTEKLPVDVLDKHCLDTGKLIYKQPWAKNLGGINCNYIPKGAPTDRDSVLGGVFKTKAEITQ